MKDHDKKAKEIDTSTPAWMGGNNDLSDDDKDKLSEQINSSGDKNNYQREKTLFEEKNLDEKLRNIT